MSNIETNDNCTHEHQTTIKTSDGKLQKLCAKCSKVIWWTWRQCSKNPSHMADDIYATCSKCRDYNQSYYYNRRW